VCWNCLYSLPGDVGNLMVQVMLKLPSGETVSCSMPSVVILPALSAAAAGTIMSQSTADPSVKTMQLMPDHRLTEIVSYGDHVLGRPSLSLNSQGSVGLPAVTAVSSGTVTNTYSPAGAVVDLQESGLRTLGIAASTREVCVCCIYVDFFFKLNAVDLLYSDFCERSVITYDIGRATTV